MFKVPYTQLREKIIASGKITPRDLDEKIKTKINELSGLISEEGAAHIIANELGVSVMNADQQKLKIKEIMPGMRNVSVAGKVVRKFDVREFAKGEVKGKVASILIGDESGSIRCVFWNDQVDQFLTISENDVVLVKDGYVKENAGGKEVHLGDKASIEINPEGVEITSVRASPTAQRKSISALAADDQCEVLGTVIQVFDPRYWNTCPTCNKKVMDANGSFSCATHGVVQPGISYVMNAVVDDGSGNIRCVFWKQQTNSLTGKSEVDFVVMRDQPGSFENTKNDLLGEQIKMVGKVQKNEMFARLELNVSSVEKASPEDELKRLEQK